MGITCYKGQQWFPNNQACNYNCYKGNCDDGQIRLVGGEGEWEGRLEVCYNGRWGTVGADNWTLTNSHVICNSLGYEYSGKNYLHVHLSHT